MTRRLIYITTALVGLLGLTATALADVIVQFESTTYVTADQPYGRGWTSEGGTDANGDGDGDDDYIAFNTTTPFSPAANYTGPTFYGGWVAEGARDVRGNSGVADQTDNDAGSNDSAIMVELEQIDRGVIAFLKSDFLNGGDTGPVTFDATSSLTFEASNLYGNNTIRLLVRDGSDWYIGETHLGNSASFNPANENFAPFALAEGDKKIEFTGSTYNVSGATFTDVTAVGTYHVNSPRSKSGVSTFAIDAVVIPEPATLALLGLGGAAFVARRQRRA